MTKIITAVFHDFNFFSASKNQDIKGFPALPHSAAFLDLWTD